MPTKFVKKYPPNKPKTKCFTLPNKKVICENSKGAKKNFNQRKIKKGESAIRGRGRPKRKEKMTAKQYKAKLGKKIKDMTAAERKEYNRLRVQTHRGKKYKK